MKLTRLGKVGAAGAALALILTGCAGGADSAGDSGDSGGDAGAAGSAVLYTSTNETTNDVLVNAARDLDPSLKIDVVTGSSGPLHERIKTEAATADAFWGGNGANYVDVAEPFRAAEADKIIEAAQDPENRWTPTNQHVVALMVNVDQLDSGKAPTSWEDLTGPAYAGKIIVADPTASTTALTALYGAYKVLGEADFAKLAANLQVTESSSNVYPAVAQGEYAVAIAYESNIYPYIAGGQPGIEMIYPSDGTFAEYDAIILVDDAPNPEGGKRVIDTLLSKEVQEEMLVESFRRPVRTDIDVAEFVDFKPLDELDIVDIHTTEDNFDEFLAYWATL